MGILKWLLIFIVVSIVAILILPIPVLYAIFSMIGKGFSLLFNALTSKMNEVSAYNNTHPTSANAPILPPSNALHNSSTKSKNIILNVS